MKIAAGGNTIVNMGAMKYEKMVISRQFHRCMNQLQKDGHKNTTQKVENQGNLYYYEIPGNKLNPHTYFYRVLAVPFLKFCGVMLVTYYGMNGLWGYLEDRSEEKEDH